MPSLHPLTHVINAIENPHIKQALLDRLGGRDRNTLSPGEVPGLFKAGAENDRSVRGHDMTESELNDYLLIHSQGGEYLFKSDRAAKAYSKELRKYTGLPTVEAVESDPGLGVRSKVALNKAELSGVANGDLCPSGVVCIIGGPTTASLKVNGETFSVQPEGGEGHASIARRLAAEVEASGFKVKVTSTKAKSTITVGAPKALHIANLTTDHAVRLGVQGNKVTVDVGIGAGDDLSGGRIGLRIGAKAYTVPTVAGEPASIALTLLRRQIEAAGFEVKVAGLPTIDTIHELWTIRPAHRPYVGNGQYATISGTVVVDGDQRRLQVEQGIQVDNAVVHSLDLRMSSLPAGPVTLSGRVRVEQGETLPVQYMASLSGITNITAGEPAYDGEKFTNSAGKECVARYVPHDPNGPLEVPSRMFVFDQSNDTAFLGGNGGMPNPHNDFNGFYGFDRTRAIDGTPSRTDIGSVQFRVVNDTQRAREEWPHSRATGEPLVEMEGPGRPDTVAGRRYFMDRASETVYVYDIESATERNLAQVIKRDPRDV